MTTILVTGATGTIGRATLQALADKPGLSVKAGVRKDSFAKLPAGVAPVELDWERPATLAPALAGVERVLLITPVTRNADELVAHFVDAARKAGVKHIVKLSAAGADAEPGIFLTRLHRTAERAIEGSGIGFTHLRPNMFAENLVNYWPPQKDGNIYVPFGDSGVAYVASADIGVAAANILAAPDAHRGKAYFLSGPRAVGTAEVAALLAKAAGRDIRYVNVPPEAARQSMLAQQMPAWMVDGFLELFALAKAGVMSGTSPELASLLGRAPTTLESWVEANRNAWR